MRKGSLLVILIAKFVSTCSGKSDINFLWGSATASYQVEGAFNEDGRGMTVWDAFSHTPGKVANGDNGDIADDNYHRFEEDIDMMANMGLNSYRFSIAWSRILPKGEGDVNQAGISHYNAVIDKLVSVNIVPFVTLFHWDTPLVLEQKYGGWLNDTMETHFAQYADICFAKFGDRVKHWLTFNEPMSVALNGYLYGSNAPGRCSDRSKCTEGNSSTEPYIVSHNILNAHAAAVELYRAKYQPFQDGRIGITLNTDFAYPLTDSPEDSAAAERNLEFQAGWYADPVFFGDYPASMKRLVGERLPAFTTEQSERVRGSHDFYGLNHYTSKFVSNNEIPIYPSGGWADDQRTVVSNTDSSGNLIGAQAASSWLNVVPSGMLDLLLWLSTRYGRHTSIYITENGCDVPGESQMSLDDALHDSFRVDYYSGYLGSVMEALRQGVRVEGYYAWSLMDNFEWADGYDYRFGLHFVDFNDNLKRYQKQSAIWFSNYTKYYP